jgi:hypothetical protein
MYRVVVTNASGYVTSDAATLTVNSDPPPDGPSITSHPQNATVTSGGTASFSVSATGASLTYQWERSPDGSSWTAITGANAAAYSFTAQSSNNGSRYRVVVSNAYGSTTSSAATLTVNSGSGGGGGSGSGDDVEGGGGGCSAGFNPGFLFALGGLALLRKRGG